MIKVKKAFPLLLAYFAIACFLGIGATTTVSGAPANSIASSEVIEKIQQEGSARVIVKMRTPRLLQKGAPMSRARMLQRRAEIAKVRGRVKGRLKNVWHKLRHEFNNIPYIALEIDAAGLAKLEAAGLDVESIHEDQLLRPFLADSIPQIEGDLALQGGLDGSGSVIAVIDSGIDSNHSFLADKVIEEACFSSGFSGTGGDCPNGQAIQIGSGAGVPCSFAPSTCRHGTHVAGIAAGSGSSFSGVAPGANLISIQVFHASQACYFFEATPCARAYESDIVAALEHVLQLGALHPIAAVNMSLGAEAYTTNCNAEYPAFADAIDNLKTAGIATVVASGNDGFDIGISVPSCISSAISVGAIDDVNDVAFFSNVSPDLDLFAPGTSINSSVTGGGFESLDGTSMAAPHVAGAWALMLQANSGASVDANLALLKSTGRPITDFRPSDPETIVTRPGIRLGAVVGIESPLPVLTSIAPTTIGAGGSQAITVTGSDFVPGSVVMADGVAMPTAFVSATQLNATVIAKYLPIDAGSHQVSVFTPPLGGGTSASTALEIVPPDLSVSATAVDWGQPVTVTLNGGPGNDYDWIALAAVGDPDTVYLDFVYVPPGASATTWTISMPDTAGDYEFRMFADNGYTRLATSPTVTVTSSAPPPPPPNLALSANAVEAGAPVTVTLSDGPGNDSDWIALAAVGDPDTAYIDYVYVSPGASTATWTVNMPAEPGTYEFRLLENNGYTRLATSSAVTVTVPEPASASLTPSATAVNPGDAVTVTLSDGPGNDSDWIALAAVGDADTTYLQYIYVAPGSSTASWTVNMPAEAGAYEFRLFENNGYTRLATSSAVTVTAPEPGDASLAVSATEVSPGAAVTVTLSDGPGNDSDWIALAAVGDADASYLQYIYVASGSSTATWTVNMPAAAGTYEFRLFENNGYTRLATSPVVTVSDPEPEPGNASLTVSATAVDPGAAVTVTLSGGPGNASDWIALAAVGDADASYLQYVYVASGSSTASWTVNMPAAPGAYEFRLFENNGYTRLATSQAVTVTDPAPSSATLEVSATAVDGGDSVTVTLSGGPGNANDWIALAAVGDADASYLQYVYVAAGSSTASWTVTMPSAPGSYEFRLFENNGYTRLATSPAVTVTDPVPSSATLAVSATTVNAGDSVTVTLSDGPGNANDWIALAAVGAADTVYLDNVYVPPGSTTATWTVTMPSAPGDYEFRLFENFGYTRLATSVTVKVAAPPPSALAVSTTAAAPGDPVTVTLSGGPGNGSDWIALAEVGAAETVYVDYVYVAPGATTASWTVNMPAGSGDYEFRLFENNSYTRLATSPAVTVSP